MSNIHNIEKLSALFVSLIFDSCLLLLITVAIPFFENQSVAQGNCFKQPVSNYDFLANFLFFYNFYHNYNIYNI